MGIDRRRYLMLHSSRRAVSEEKAYAYVRLTTGPMYWSQDAGSSWSQRDSGITAEGGLAVAKDNSALATGNGGQLWYFDVSGSYISQPITGTTRNLCESSGSEYIYYTVNSGTSWATGYSTTLYKKSGRAASAVSKKVFSTWDQAAPNAMACSADGKYICVGGLAGYTNGFTSVDFGENWTETLATSSYGNGTTGVDMSADGKYTLVGSQGGLNRSVDSLASFTHDNNSAINAVAVSGDGNVMYYDMSGAFRRSIDHGASWVTVGSLSGFSKIVCSYFGQVVLAIGSSSHNLFKSTDYGATWTTVISTGNVSDVVLNKFGV